MKPNSTAKSKKVLQGSRVALPKRSKHGTRQGAASVVAKSTVGKAGPDNLAADSAETRNGMDIQRSASAAVGLKRSCRNCLQIKNGLITMNGLVRMK